MPLVSTTPFNVQRLFWAPAYSAFYIADTITVEFGAGSFTYSVPPGYSTFPAGTWDPANRGSGITLSGGNLIANGNDAAHHSGAATWNRISGKWYWETIMGVGGGGNSVYAGILAVGEAVEGNFLGQSPNGIGMAQTGGIARNNTLINTLPSFATSSVLRHKLDLDAQTYEIAVNAGVFTLVDTLEPI